MPAAVTDKSEIFSGFTQKTFLLFWNKAQRECPWTDDDVFWYSGSLLLQLCPARKPWGLNIQPPGKEGTADCSRGFHWLGMQVAYNAFFTIHWKIPVTCSHVEAGNYNIAMCLEGKRKCVLVLSQSLLQGCSTLLLPLLPPSMARLSVI